MKFSNLDDPVADYVTAIDSADTLQKLRLALVPFAPIAADAVDLVAEWSDDDFKDWRKALKKERRGRFMGERASDRFSAVMAPSTMFMVSLYAESFHAPWGLTFNRLKEIGHITKNKGSYFFRRQAK